MSEAIMFIPDVTPHAGAYIADVSTSLHLGSQDGLFLHEAKDSVNTKVKKINL